jgi:hypothetical protein
MSNDQRRRIAHIRLVDGFTITVPKEFGVDTGYSGWSEFRPFDEKIDPHGIRSQQGWTSDANAGSVYLRPPVGSKTPAGTEIEVPRSKCVITWVPVEAPKDGKR